MSFLKLDWVLFHACFSPKIRRSSLHMDPESPFGYVKELLDAGINPRACDLSGESVYEFWTSRSPSAPWPIRWG